MAPSHSSLRAASLLSIFAAAQALSGQSNQLETRQSPTFSEIGCFVDGENGRALKRASTAGNDMTVDKCANFCGLDYKYFGVEYGSECFCSNEYAASTAQSSTECSFTCAGNPSQTCGAGNRINIYNNLRYSPRAPGSVEGKLYQGCFVDNGNPRVLPSNLLGSDILTAELCAEHCDGYAYFGLEYGRECWCGVSAPTVPAPESECSFPCAGNDRELCGAGGRINVFGPVPPAVGDFSYQGCFTDNNDDRVLSGKVVLDGAMTVELCESSCAGYSWFGLEYGSQCYCGTFLKSSAQKRTESECSMVCGGDSTEKCGAANRLNVYSTGVSQQPDNLLTVRDFSYLSCYTDSGGARSLTGASSFTTDMTIEQCADFCEDFGYFGVEYSTQCFCGDVLGGTPAAEGTCSQLCGGDPTELCGGPDRLNVYVKSAPASSSSSAVSASSTSPASAVSSSSAVSSASLSASSSASASSALAADFSSASSTVSSASFSASSSASVSSSLEVDFSSASSTVSSASLSASSSHHQLSFC